MWDLITQSMKLQALLPRSASSLLDTHLITPLRVHGPYLSLVLRTLWHASTYKAMQLHVAGRLQLSRCICACAPTSARTHNHTHARTHNHTHTHTHTFRHTRARMHSPIHTYTHARTHALTITHACTHLCSCAHMHMWVGGVAHVGNCEAAGLHA